MECDFCKKWYHITCESIKPAYYDKLTTLKSIDQLHWYCKRCNPKCTDVLKLVAEISEREKSLAEQVQIYSDKVDIIAHYEDPTFLKKTKQLIREETHEIRMRELRECNLILTNMEEDVCNNESRTVTEEDSDMTRVTDMIQNVL